MLENAVLVLHVARVRDPRTDLRPCCPNAQLEPLEKFAAKGENTVNLTRPEQLYCGLCEGEGFICRSSKT
jgi:hypothetical protein